MGRIYSEEERKDLARYTKRLRYNLDTQKDYWEIVKDKKEVVGTAAFSVFANYNKEEE
jgi:hypothetical protein|tara:strand:- start:359 stop:532 length:174 start_codon:yes stop_codon:yes gene_type:complete